MKYPKLLGLWLLLVALAATGCSEKGGTPRANTKHGNTNKFADHAHGKGPNGGAIFDLGKHHAEFVVDHAKTACTVFILRADKKTPVPVAAEELTATITATKTKGGKPVPTMTLKLLPENEVDGKAAKFVGTAPQLGNLAEFAGIVIGEIDGRPSQGEFNVFEHHDHDHSNK